MNSTPKNIEEKSILPFIELKKHLIKKLIFAIETYTNLQGLPNCCSSKAIAFHYIKPDMMTWMEYVLYHLRPLTNNYKILK